MKPALRTACVALVLALPAVVQAWSDQADGALTLVTQYGPDYLGARHYGVSAKPGLYLRWGALSISSGGSWASPRQDDDLRGLGLELARTDAMRLSLGLRMDSGRKESGSPSLAGMGDVRRTVRLRLGGSWAFDSGWELRAGWTIDAFGRGGGNLGELKLQRDWRLSPSLLFTAAAQTSLGGDRYMQTYYGVTPEQSARSGYRVYSPRLGLRDVSLTAALRLELSDDWVALGAVGYSRLLGDAARSPLVLKRDPWSLSGGIGWRF